MRPREESGLERRSARRGPRGWQRAWRLLAKGILVIVVLPILLASWAAYTDAGRNQLRRLSAYLVNDTIAGKLEIATLERLDLDGIALRGLKLVDPLGEQVLYLEKLDLEFSPAALFHSRAQIDALKLVGLRLDLQHLDDKDRGLLAALTMAPSKSGTNGGPSAWSITLKRLELTDGEFEFALPKLGTVTVRSVALVANAEVGKDIRANLQSLSAELHDDTHLIAKLVEADAVYRTDGSPSSLQVEAHAGAAKVALRARALIPPNDNWQHHALGVDLRATNLGADLLRRAGIEPPEELGEPFTLTAMMRGTPADLDVEMRLTSPGGTIGLDANLRDRDALALRLSAHKLQLNQLWRGLPSKALSVELSANMRLADAPQVLPFEITLSRGHFGKDALPTAALTGRLEGDRLRAFELLAQGYGASLKMQGEAGLDGSADASVALAIPHIGAPLRLVGNSDAAGAIRLLGHLKVANRQLEATAQAELSALHIDALRLDSAQVSITAKGSLLAPAITAVVKTGRGSWNTTVLDPSSLRIAGGPKRYRLHVDAGPPGRHLLLQADIERERRGIVVNARGSGRLAGKPLSLRAQAVRLGFDGRLKVGALEVAALGQKLSVHGALQGRRSDVLRLETQKLDLAALSAALGLQPPLRGDASMRMTIAGSLERPRIQLNGQAHDLHLPKAQTAGRDIGTISANWSGMLDTRRGALNLQAQVNSRHKGEPGPKATFALNGTFPPRRAWAKQLGAGTYSLRLAFDDLKSAYLEGILGQTLPVQGALGGLITAEGPLRDPIISVKAHASARHPQSGAPTNFTASAHYEAGDIDLMLDSADPRGQWLWFELEATNPHGSLSELVARASRLADEATWRARLEIAQRRLDRLPVAIDWPQSAKPLRLSASLTATHTAGAEPHIELDLEALYPPFRRRRPAAPRRAHDDPHCAPRPMWAKLHAKSRLGELSARLSAGAKHHRWLDLKGSAKLALADMLRGETAPRPSQVGYNLQLARVHASEIPVVCETMRGTVAGQGQGRELLGAQPKASVRLQLAGLALGGRQTLDGQVDVSLDHSMTKLVAKLDHAGHDNRVVAQLPLSLSDGHFQLKRASPIEAKVSLKRLPLAALIPPHGPVSRVSGFLTGAMNASGTLADPKVNGAINMHDLALTATAVAQPLVRINGTIAFDNQQIRIEKLVARDKEGTATVNGAIEIGKLPKSAAFNLGLALKDFPVRQDGQVAATVNLKARVSANIGREHTEAKLSLRDVAVWLEESRARGIALKPHPDIVDPRRPKVRAAATKGPKRSLRLAIDMSQPFWIKRDDLAVRLSSRLDVRVGSEGARVTGKARIERGFLQLLGSTFDIDRGSSITFVGSVPPDPVVNISAHMVNRRTGRTIAVIIGGRAHQPELAFLLDGDEVTAGEVVAAMFGGGSNDDGNAAEGQAKSLVAGIAGGMLALAARKELGEAAPIILVDAGKDAAHSRLRAGFDLEKLVPNFMRSVIRGVYVEGIVAGDDGTNTGGVHGGALLDLFLPKSLVLSGQYGPGETWAVDFGWEP